ncbi:hypothetical protein SAMD00019534_010520, partial [Acytostelium subglobosum LB1]|uniref:hypothetical protein n=1 Tax=Acytostelium subglobosum LB1 TaxID=1410327 RepID=UPI000644B505
QSIMTNKTLVASLDQDKIIKHLEHWIKHQINALTIPVIGITITNAEKTLYANIIHHEHLLTPVPSLTRSLFNVASVSKLFTYVALLQLVDSGKVKLEDPVTKHIPKFAPTNPDECPAGSPPLYPNITLFNLIRHTSGLIREPIEGNYFNPIQCDLNKLVESMCTSKLVNSPGIIHKYSNAAVAVAGYIVQVVSGMSFEDYVEKNILDPIGMSHCTFQDKWNNTRYKDEDEMRLAVGHMWRYWDEFRNTNVFSEAPLTRFGMFPAGGLKCTIEEISAFLRVFLNGGAPLLKDSTFIQMVTPQPLAQPTYDLRKDYNHTQSDLTHGLGVEISQVYGLMMARHGGAINGFASEFRTLPALGIGIYTVCTLDCINSVSNQVAEYAIQLILNYMIEHGQLGDLTIDLAALAAATDHYRSLAKAEHLPVMLRNQVLGVYHFNNYNKDMDTHRFRIYQEYNTKTYIRSHFINSIDWIRPSHCSQIFKNGVMIINDRLSFGQPLEVSTSADGKDTAVGMFERQKELSDNNLFFQPYIPLPEVTKPPEPAPKFLQALVGHYETKDQLALIFEEDGSLMLCIEWLFIYTLNFLEKREADRTVVFKLNRDTMYNDEKVIFFLDASERPIRLELVGIPFIWTRIGPAPGERQPGVGTIELAQEMLEISYTVPCPHPEVPLNEHNLVDLSTISPTIKIDCKYASTDNFLYIQLYKIPKAFLHRKAAESLLQVHKWLHKWGVGLLIYDAYRPWNVTWTMAESVIPEFRGKYVADPNLGSVHNRGGAVDLTLYELDTGAAIPMQGEYDELSIRSHRSFFGGTTRQRWFKKLLTVAMMNFGFRPYENEWWHFDYKDSFPVLNIPFDKL